VETVDEVEEIHGHSGAGWTAGSPPTRACLAMARDAQVAGMGKTVCFVSTLRRCKLLFRACVNKINCCRRGRA
jgi:hypothetical protein